MAMVAAALLVNPKLAVSDQMKPYLLIAVTLGIFVLVWFLAAMFRREEVKRDLRQRGCRPIHIWWRVTAWWSPWFEAMPYRVIYSDSNGLIHKANCHVGHSLPALPLDSLRVRWVKDEIIGRLPSPEVRVSEEILLQKLKDQNDRSGEKKHIKNPGETPEL